MTQKKQKRTSCRPGWFWDNEQDSVQNMKKIKGNSDFVRVVFLSLQFSGIGYHKESL